MTENWLPVPDFEGYFVSDLGRVMGRKGWILKPNKDGPGYLTVHPYIGEHIYSRRVHRLVLEAFVGPRPPGMEACHGEGGKFDNSLSNLSWGTGHKNRGLDKRRDGTDNAGERNSQSKLTANEVREIREIYASGLMSQARIGEIYGVSKTTISHITLKLLSGGWVSV